MVIGSSEAPPRRSGEAAAREVIWHELECGSYRADRALWRELAAAAAAAPPPSPPGGALPRRGRVIDVGAGTGRVARDLALTGHRVTAVDNDPDLLAALASRPGGSEIQIVCADARSFGLSRDDFDACFIPMQTIQLLGGPDARRSFFHCARAHVRGGGLVAVAIVTAVEPFDCAAGELGPQAESVRHGDALYLSRPTRVEVGDGRIVIERERRVFERSTPLADGGPSATEARDRGPAEREVSVLFEVSVGDIEREGGEAGLEAERVVRIAPTADHVGSEVVVFRA
jgi:SAM-dependent methyltransferase